MQFEDVGPLDLAQVGPAAALVNPQQRFQGVEGAAVDVQGAREQFGAHREAGGGAHGQGKSRVATAEKVEGESRPVYNGAWEIGQRVAETCLSLGPSGEKTIGKEIGGKIFSLMPLRLVNRSDPTRESCMRPIFAGFVVLGAWATAVGGEGEKKTAPTPREQYLALVKGYDKALADYYKAIRLEMTKGEQAKAAKLLANARRFLQRFVTLAEKYPKDPVAVDALTWVVLHRFNRDSRKGGPAYQALTLLRRDHLASTRLVPVIEHLAKGLDKPGETFLRQVISKNPHRGMRGHALFALAQSRQEVAYWSQKVKENKELRASFEEINGKALVNSLLAKDPRKLTEESERLFERITKEFGNVKTKYRRKETTLGKLAGRFLFELRQLQVGKVIPNLEGKDLEGKVFTLRGQRGKVVVLAFWTTSTFLGDWFINHQRTVVKKFKGKAMVMVSINADAKERTLTTFLKKNPMPWTHLYDGADGGIIEKWNVRKFPTYYVIDAKGVIRSKGNWGNKMKTAVEKILVERNRENDKKSGR
jgi:peroxiredoxin